MAAVFDQHLAVDDGAVDTGGEFSHAPTTLDGLTIVQRELSELSCSQDYDTVTELAWLNLNGRNPCH